MEKFWVGLLGVVVGGFITTWREWWMDRRNKNNDARYLAIRVVCMLDKFINQCSDVVADDGEYQGQRNQHGELEIQAETPKLEFESLVVNWNSIPADLMYRILSLPNRIYVANESIGSVWEYVGPIEDVIDERQSQYARLGLEALNIVEGLCKKYRIEEHQYNRNSHSIKLMQKHRIRVLKYTIMREKEYKKTA